MWNAISIWTRVAVSISYDDNHYTTSTSNILFNLYHLYADCEVVTNVAIYLLFYYFI